MPVRKRKSNQLDDSFEFVDRSSRRRTQPERYLNSQFEESSPSTSARKNDEDGDDSYAPTPVDSKPSSGQVADQHNLTEVDDEYDENDYEELSVYKNFFAWMRPKVCEVNAGLSVAHVTKYIAAKWREYQLINPILIEKNKAAESKRRPKDKSKKKRKKGDEDSSDSEFEALLVKMDERQDQDQKDKDKEKAARKRRKMLKAAKAAVKRGEQEDFEHFDNCEECRQRGELVLCESCPRVYHVVCIDPDLEDPPEEFRCAVCLAGGDKDISSEEEKVEVGANQEFCSECKEGGFLLCCETCPLSFHTYCVIPLLEQLPAEDETWYCPRCQVQADYKPDKEPHHVITWRWTEVKEPEWTPSGAKDEIPPPWKAPDGKVVRRRFREYFVKWKYHSYWYCEWIDERVLEMHFYLWIIAYRSRRRREFGPEAMEDTPIVEDYSQVHRKKENDDPQNLRERFYKYGIKPQWLLIHKILNYREYSKKEFGYLVRWKGLPYDYSTWEDDGDDDVDGLHEAVLKYWQQKFIMINEKPPKYVLKTFTAAEWNEKEMARQRPPKSPTSDLSVRLAVQPKYIDLTGGKMHDYQMEGLNWLRYSWAHGTDTILADEMGLGKTIQCIAFLYSLFKEGHCSGPFLITAPLSTVPNWEREFDFWAPDFVVVNYTGLADQRIIIREHELTYNAEALGNSSRPTRMKTTDGLKFHVVLTSYEMIHYEALTLGSIDWTMLVVDEAHRLKNSQSLFFRTLTDKYRLGYKLLLTGTPLQNNLEELFNLLNFMSPEQFPDLESFTGEFTDLSKEDQIQKLHAIMGHHMLRRMKTDVLKHMPPKSELIVRVDLTPLQKKYYKWVLGRNYHALNAKGSGKHVSLNNIMMELRKVCNHPFLFPQGMIEAPRLPNNAFEGSALTKGSGKLLVLSKMLAKLKEQNHRVLIFSQFTTMLDLLEDFLEYEGYFYERLDGNVAGLKRQESIDRFNAPDSKTLVFLLSTKAGGLGINLATADTVVIFDSDWNPHNDIQAFSRAHRIGQKNTVLIFRFVTRKSVEERITTAAKKKMLLTHLVVRGGLKQYATEENKSATASMTKTELDDVLRWGTEELFKDDAESDKDAIVWNDETIEMLLNRDLIRPAPVSESVTEEPEKEDWSNEYLSSFKVANYELKEVEDDEKEEKAEEETKEDESIQEPDPNYWEKLLRHHYEQQVEDSVKDLGKGKRVRKKVNYAMNANAADVQTPEKKDDDSEFSVASSATDTSSDDDDVDSKDEETKQVSKREVMKMKQQKKPKDEERMPPLVNCVSGQIEVLGFTPRQRRGFAVAVMRWGIPHTGSYNSHWLIHDLKYKSEKVFKAYVSLFMRHLCDGSNDAVETFSDGVPREGLNRQHVLTRIGVMALVRKKVHNYERTNGIWSIPGVYEERRRQELERAAKIDEKEEKLRSVAKKQADEMAMTTEIDSNTNDETVVEPRAELGQSESKEVASDIEEKKPTEGVEPSEKVAILSEKTDDVTLAEFDCEVETPGDEGRDISMDDTADDDELHTSTEIVNDGSHGFTLESVFENQADVQTYCKQNDVTMSQGGKYLQRYDCKHRKTFACTFRVKVVLEGLSGDSATKQQYKCYTKGEHSHDYTNFRGVASHLTPVVMEGVKKGESFICIYRDVQAASANTQDQIPKESSLRSLVKLIQADMAKSKGPLDDSQKSDLADLVSPDDDDTDEEEDKKKFITTKTKQKPQERFEFDIQDGNHTELHTLWRYESKAVAECNGDFQIWNKRHDYWLLAGIVTHGYGRYLDIKADIRFEILNQPFCRTSDETSQIKFIQRRFKLLEQALVIEEQLRRASKLSFDRLFEGSLSETTDTEKKAEEPNESLVKTEQDKMNAVQYKVLLQMEQLLSDVHSDVSRMPVTVQRLDSVSDRLNKTQKIILKQLFEAAGETISEEEMQNIGVSFFNEKMVEQFGPSVPHFMALAKDFSGFLIVSTI